jgi:hypothetical protein
MARMEHIGEFVTELAGFTAGALVTATFGPAAGAFAGMSAQQVVKTFLDVEKKQRTSLAAMNQQLGGGLARIEVGLFQLESGMQELQADVIRMQRLQADVQSGIQELQADVQIQLEEPWKTALDYLKHATEPGQKKAARKGYLDKARDKLFEAKNMARSDARRALVSQRLAAVSLMLGNEPSARLSLVEAYPASKKLVKDAAAVVEREFKIEWNPESKARVGGEVKRIINDEMTISSILSYGIPSHVELFWAHYILSTRLQREQICNGQEVRSADEAIKNSIQVRALRQLHWMTNDLSKLCDACCRLGAEPSDVPRQSLHVNIVPFKPTSIRLIRKDMEPILAKWDRLL